MHLRLFVTVYLLKYVDEMHRFLVVMETESVAWLTFSEREHVHRAERERDSGKLGERERSGEREAAERRAGVTKIGLSCEYGPY